MYFKMSCRTNVATGVFEGYYRLIESYRNNDGKVSHRTILNIGFIEDALKAIQLNKIARILTDTYEKKTSLFIEEDVLINKWVAIFWAKIIASGNLDITVYDKNNRFIDVDTVKHTHVREIGAEWMCYNIWQDLEIDKLLEENEFTELEIQLAQSQIISKALYPKSELATARWINENSAVSELTGYPLEKMNKDRLYKSALKLHTIKDKLEQHLSVKTNELFDIQDKILLYDLTNTYFEGENRNSVLAKFGRSKEKRSDAKLVVLALVINIYGFIKYSAIHEGNFSDSAGLEKVLDDLNTVTGNINPLIVLDAGIATEANLKLIVEKGCDYLCVSRTKLKDYAFDTSRLSVILETKSKKEVILKKIISPKHTDYFLEVNSAAKALKEQGMKTQFETRFEAELEKISIALAKKYGTKSLDKIHQRIGRAKQKYPSIQQKYIITVSPDEDNKNAITLSWQKDPHKEAATIDNLGKYFIRTSLDLKEEVRVWNVYNTIREIENTFRTLKTDLDLRPIYHKKDVSTMAHLHLGLLAYWLVNTIRCTLKAKGIHHNWQEIVRIGNTQKVITTTGLNKAKVEISIRKCSEPTEKLKEIQTALNIKSKPFKKLESVKSVVHRPPLKKIKMLTYKAVRSG
jgi:hypothetical protein